MQIRGTDPVPYADIIRVNIEHSGDGLYVATSHDLPGFFIAHPDLNEVQEDIPNVIRVLIRRRTKQDVLVARVSPRESEPNSWVSIPALTTSRGASATQ